jgi:hypothetical protein
VKVRHFWLSLVTGLLVPCLSLAQTPATKSSMYEDIEIMRRLLDTKLQTAVPFFKLTAACSSCHVPDIGRSPWLEGSHIWIAPSDASLWSLNRQQRGNSFADLYSTSPASGFYNLHTHANLTWETQSTGLEGVYLKEQGVVYTLTLPPQSDDPKPSIAKSKPRPLTDWERMRKELRGEKSEDATANQKPKAPSVADVILKVLADNGHNFSHLGAKESLTVVVTFRKGNAAVFHHNLSGYSNTINLGLLALGAARNEPAPKNGKPSPKEGGADKDVRDSVANVLEFLGKDSLGKSSSANDHELLGDLHLKQSRAQEAIKAYEKAVEQKPGT